MSEKQLFLKKIIFATGKWMVEYLNPYFGIYNMAYCSVFIAEISSEFFMEVLGWFVEVLGIVELSTNPPLALSSTENISV